MIPNIVKGTGITGALAYAMGQGNDQKTGKRKALEEGHNSRAEILGGQNFGFEIDSEDRLAMARRMMEWNGKAENQASRGRKCQKDCLHASLSWEIGQEPTPEDMTKAAQGFLKSLGMEKAQAVFIAHDDKKHKHLHIVASRLDPATGKTYSQEEDFSKAQAWSLRYEREQGQIPQNEARRNLHKIVDAIEARDGAALVKNLTQRNPTFTARDLDQALKYGQLTKDERTAFRTGILAQKNVIGLRETADAKVSRYTTREVLAAEMGLVRSAKKLADQHHHGLSETRVEETAAAFTLNPEQAVALARLTGAEGFSVLLGQAGTGKSHTLKATRAAYEAEGAKVVGLSWTNDVVQQMRGDGFKETTTVAAALHAIDDGRAAWGKNTVLIVDEAAMVATEHLASLAAAADRAGAKLILAGDDKQLSSIERGGMFETLRQRHGAAVLEEVQRVKEADQKAAFNQMHEGEFRKALATFDKAGGIHFSEKQDDALRAMAHKYAEGVEAAPDKSRFMVAFTNAEVGALNLYARELHRQRGDLGEDVTLQTKHGEETFATGDRIQFTGNGYGQCAKNAGLTNGRVGTITAIEIEGDFFTARMTVELDTATGKKPQRVSFVVGEDGKAGEFQDFHHGYAGTVYKSQGRTLDGLLVAHHKGMRSAASYVALTRHREDIHIFASEETIRGMETKAERNSFVQAAAAVVLDDAAFEEVTKAHNLDIMARGFARPENRRAATAYAIDEQSALRLDFSDVARVATAEASEAPESSRGYDRVQATRDAQRQQQRQPSASAEPPQTAEVSEGRESTPAESSSRKDERLVEALKAEKGSSEAKKAALQELTRLFGREVNQQEGAEIQRDRGGGQSL